MTKKDEEDFRSNNICQFCEKNIESDKFRYHCHLTGNFKGPAHNACNKNVNQKVSIFNSIRNSQFQ